MTKVELKPCKQCGSPGTSMQIEQNTINGVFYLCSQSAWMGGSCRSEIYLDVDAWNASAVYANLSEFLTDFDRMLESDINAKHIISTLVDAAGGEIHVELHHIKRAPTALQLRSNLEAHDACCIYLVT